jgi:BioD-like phosphotransacetylase family protein
MLSGISAKRIIDMAGHLPAATVLRKTVLKNMADLIVFNAQTDLFGH